MNTRPAAPGQAGQAVVTMPAEIDIANSSRLEAVLLAAFRPVVRLVIADLSATTFCDSSGVRMLATAARHAAAHDQELRVVVCYPAVLRIFELVGIDRAAPVFPSLGAGMASASEPVTEAS